MSELQANAINVYSGTHIEVKETLKTTDTDQDILCGGKMSVGSNTAPTEQLKVTGDAKVTGATILDGNITAGGSLTTTGGLTSNGGLIVDAGVTRLDEATTITAGGLTVGAGGAAITGNVSVNGSTTLTGTNTLAGATTVSTGGLTVTAGGANITGSLTVDGEAITGGSTGTNYTKAFAKITYDFSGPTATVNANSNVNGVVISQTDYKITITFTTGIGNDNYVVMMNSTQDGLEGSGTTLIHTWYVHSQASANCEVRLRGGENADAGVLHFTVMSA